MSLVGSANDEEVVIVDRENRVVGSAPRRRMREEGLLHRATYILITDASGRLYVQKRTLTKDVYPGYWDPVTGGVVLAGESYEEGAKRELAEEMGIRGVDLETRFDFWFEDGRAKVWGRLFTCQYDGELALQAEEVEQVEMMTPEEVLQRSETENFTPDGLLAVRRWLRFVSG